MADNNEVQIGFTAEDRQAKQALDQIVAKLEHIERQTQKTARTSKKGQQEFTQETEKSVNVMDRFGGAVQKVGGFLAAAFSVQKLAQYISMLDEAINKAAKLRGSDAANLASILAQTGDEGSAARIEQQLAGMTSPFTFQQRAQLFGQVSGEAPGASLEARLRLTALGAGPGAVAAGGRAGFDVAKGTAGFAADLLEKGGLTPDQAADLAQAITEEAGGADPRQVVEFAERYAAAGGSREEGFALGLAAIRSGQRPEFLKTAMSQIETQKRQTVKGPGGVEMPALGRLQGMEAPQILQLGLAGRLTPEEERLVFGTEGVMGARAFNADEFVRLRDRFGDTSGELRASAQQQAQNQALRDQLMTEAYQSQADIKATRFAETEGRARSQAESAQRAAMAGDLQTQEAERLGQKIREKADAAITAERSLPTSQLRDRLATSENLMGATFASMVLLLEQIAANTGEATVVEVGGSQDSGFPAQSISG